MKARIRISALLLPCLFLAAACGSKRTLVGPPPSATQDALVRADDAFERESYVQAASLYEQYLRSGETRRIDHVHFRLGWIYASQGDNGKALRNLSKVQLETLSEARGRQVRTLIASVESGLRLQETLEKSRKIDLKKN